MRVRQLETDDAFTLQPLVNGRHFRRSGFVLGKKVVASKNQERRQ